MKKIVSRREFFKKTLSKTLPIISLTVMAGLPMKLYAENITECRGCASKCTGDCASSCRGTCYGHCDTTCKGSCISSCRGYCTGGSAQCN